MEKHVVKKEEVDEWDGWDLPAESEEPAPVEAEKASSPELTEEKPIIEAVIPLLSGEVEAQKLAKEGDISPKLWNFNDVTRFLLLNGCDEANAQILREARTDGKKLLMLNKEQLVLQMSVRDALVISRLITRLRTLEEAYVKKHYVPPPKPAYATPVVPSLNFKIPKRKMNSTFWNEKTNQSPLASPYAEKRRKLDEGNNFGSGTGANDGGWGSSGAGTNSSVANDDDDGWGSSGTTTTVNSPAGTIDDDGWGSGSTSICFSTPTSTPASDSFHESRSGDRNDNFRGRGGSRGGNGNRGRGGGRGPRPGDWSCVCGASNFVWRMDCYKCHKAKDGAGDSNTDGNQSGGNSFRGRGGRGGSRYNNTNDDNSGSSSFAQSDDDWGPSATSRTGHSTPAPVGDGDDWGDTGTSAAISRRANNGSSTQADDDGWGNGSTCTSFSTPVSSPASGSYFGSRSDDRSDNFRGRGGGGGRGGSRGGNGNRGRGGGHEPRPGDWPCSSCGANNFARRTDCFKCHQEKDDSGGSTDGGNGRDGGFRGRGGRGRGRGRGGGNGGWGFSADYDSIVSASVTVAQDDDWGTFSSSFGTGNRAPVANTVDEDDWGDSSTSISLPAQPKPSGVWNENLVTSRSNASGTQKPADDDWGTPSTSETGNQASAAQAVDDDDWGNPTDTSAPVKAKVSEVRNAPSGHKNDDDDWNTNTPASSGIGYEKSTPAAPQADDGEW